MKNKKTQDFDPFFYEEIFHAKDRKQERKKRKLAQKSDRSKYKKTDLDKEKTKKPILKKGEKIGRVLSIKRDQIYISSDNHEYICTIRGSLQKEKKKRKNLIAVGDIVHFILSSEKEGAIVSVEERRSILSRQEALKTKEQIIAVNIDQVFITVSIMKPLLKPTLIDRYIIAAKKGNMHPIIVVNKIDLLEKGSEEENLLKDMTNSYKKIDIPILYTSTKTKKGISALKKMMKDKSSVFSGQSGVGKSSLINTTTGLNLKTGMVVEKTNKGAHITTRAELIPLEGGGFCIDTPGIKSFGVWDLSEKDLLEYFPEFFQYSKGCKYPNCTHMDEPHCAVIEAAMENLISPLRFGSYRSLMEGQREKDQKH